MPCQTIYLTQGTVRLLQERRQLHPINLSAICERAIKSALNRPQQYDVDTANRIVREQFLSAYNH